MTDVAKQANVTLDQFWVVASMDRCISAMGIEAAALKQLAKHEAVEKLETSIRHLGKYRDEYLRSCQSGLVIAQAGVIPDIKGSTH